MVVDFDAAGAYGITAADVNDDGVVEILSANRDSDSLVVHYASRRHMMVVETGAAVVLDASMIEASDPDAGASSEPIFTIVEAPVLGSIELGPDPVGAGGTFTQADIDAGLVRNSHLGGDPGTDRVIVSVADVAGSLPPAFYTLVVSPPTVSVVGTSVTEPPRGTTETISVEVQLGAPAPGPPLSHTPHATGQPSRRRTSRRPPGCSPSTPAPPARTCSFPFEGTQWWSRPSGSMWCSWG